MRCCSTNARSPRRKSSPEKIRSAVVAYELVWEGRKHSVGASIGLVPVDASICTAAEVLSAADAACCEAKRQGRNRVSVHLAA